MLVTNYYTIISRQKIEGGEQFLVSLNADCEVYKGHFPGEPISPGVCNLQMIKECAELVAERELLLNFVQQCRLTTLITPLQHPQVEVKIYLLEKLENGIKLRGTIGRGDEIFMDLKGEAQFAE